MRIPKPRLNYQAMHAGFSDALDDSLQHASLTSIQAMPEAHAPPRFKAPYPPLEQVTKPNLTTNELSYYLNRRPQTLRGWASRSGTGPIQAKRIGGILAWSTVEAKVLAGVTA